MKSHLLLALALLIPARLFAADPSPAEAVTAAAKKLGEQSNYSWKTTVVVPDSAPFKPGPTEGKTEKDGFSCVSMSFGDNKTEAVVKGDKGVITDMEGNWRLGAELEKEEGPARFLGFMLKGIKPPAGQIPELLTAVKELKQEGDVYSGDMTPEGAKNQFRFGEPKNPKGSVKFWVKEGMLVKFEVKVEAKMEFGGNEFDASRTSTTECKDVGTTKVSPAEAAKKKLG